MSKIELDADWLLDNCLVWAARYCASRSSYAISYLSDYVTLINKNREKFNPNRVQHLASDLRRIASERLSFYKNVKVENYYNSCNTYEAYYLIGEYLANHPDMRFCDYNWNVDCVTGQIDIEKRDEPLLDFTGRIKSLYDMDIDIVSRAAAMLSNSQHFKVTTRYNGKEEWTIAAKHISAEQIYDKVKHETIDFKYRVVYISLNRADSYITPKYITEISKL